MDWEVKNEIQESSFGEVYLEYMLVILHKFCIYIYIYESKAPL